MQKFSEWVVAAWAHSSEAFGAIAEIERPNTPPTRRRNPDGLCNLDTFERGIDIAAELSYLLKTVLARTSDPDRLPRLGSVALIEDPRRSLLWRTEVQCCEVYRGCEERLNRVHDPNVRAHPGESIIARVNDVG